jgi:hypothetical protein
MIGCDSGRVRLRSAVFYFLKSEQRLLYQNHLSNDFELKNNNFELYVFVKWKAIPPGSRNNFSDFMYLCFFLYPK